MTTPQIRQRHKTLKDVSSSLGGSTLLSLSLFIILLAFFIVLTAISTYEEQKVTDVFDSLDITFSPNIIPRIAENSTDSENQEDNGGAGDSLEDIQGVLQSVLPGLSVDISDAPNDGKTMAIRMEKNKFERLSSQLFPVLVRILNVKDGRESYDIMMSSSVRNVLSEDAKMSYDVLLGYKAALVDKGIKGDRIMLAVERGNPAYLMVQFQKGMME